MSAQYRDALDLPRRFVRSAEVGSWRSCSFRKSKSTGLVMNSAAPYSAARRRRSSSPYAVTIITGRSGNRCLILANNCSPSISGMLMPESTATSAGRISSASRSNASAPEAANASHKFLGEPHGENADERDQRHQVRHPRPRCLRYAQTAQSQAHAHDAASGIVAP